MCSSRVENHLLQIITLSSLDGAFVSISTLSLVKQNDNEEIKIESKRHQDISKMSGDVRICQMSCEHLNVIGVLSPICEIINNMLECVNGDMGGEERYISMVDVTSDLKLMLDKPEVIPRSNETDTIFSCYRRCAAGSCEVVIIQGDSGTGKSVLLEKMLTRAAIEGGFCQNGKFDQMKQAIPFASLASTFEQYCDILMQRKELDWAKNVVNKLRAKLGQDVSCSYLFRVIPKLKDVLGSHCDPIDARSLK
jgi:hypothetical protein